MTKGNPKWEQFEHSVQELLGLRSTPGSGNQWHDVSDGRSRPEDPYKLMIDCKHTEKSSYSINGSVLNGWWDRATGFGYHFALPINLDGSNVGRQKEWVVIPLDDYVELVDATRFLNSPKRWERCGALPFNPADTTPCCRRIDHFDRHDNGKAEWTA